MDGSGNVLCGRLPITTGSRSSTPSGNFIRKWGSSGNGDGQFSYPRDGITVDTSGKVHVADTYNHRVQVFDSSGNFIRKWGSLRLAAMASSGILMA